MSTVDMTLYTLDFSQGLVNQLNPTTGLYQYYQNTQTKLFGSLVIDQPFILTNGTVSFNGQLFGRDQFNERLRELSGMDKVRDYITNFYVDLRQPLFFPNTQKIQLRNAELGLQQTQASYTKNQLDMIYQVTQAFYSLYETARRVEIAETEVSQRQDSYKTALNKFKAGLIAEGDALKLGVDLMSRQNELMSLRSNLVSQQNSIKVLIGLPLEEVIGVIPKLEYSAVATDSAKAVSEALNDRVELKNTKMSTEIAEMKIDQVDAQGRLRLDVIASYGLTRDDSLWEGAFRNFDKSNSVRLQLKVPIWDRGSSRAQVEQAEADFRNTQLFVAQQELVIKQEIIDLLNVVKLLASRLVVLQKSETVGIKSYGVSVERFKVGQITIEDLVQSQRRLTDAKISNLGALIDYKRAIADLKRKTLYDFEKDEPIKVVGSDNN
jgi:outer membrane protein TolC